LRFLPTPAKNSAQSSGQNLQGKLSNTNFGGGECSATLKMPSRLSFAGTSVTDCFEAQGASTWAKKNGSASPKNFHLWLRSNYCFEAQGASTWAKKNGGGEWIFEHLNIPSSEIPPRPQAGAGKPPSLK
jgi:hypothetical protein